MLKSDRYISGLCLFLAALTAAGLVVLASETASQVKPTENAQQQQQQDLSPKKNLSEEMELITKSLDDLMSELSVIKREAMGRLSSVKKVSSNEVEPERIRQTKVSRFVLRRVLELESESQSMRDELTKLFELGKLPVVSGQMYHPAGELKQEDHDFDEAPTRKPTHRPSTAASGMPATTSTTTTSTTLKPEEEAEKIGFDVEQLKKLGEELDQHITSLQRDGRQLQPSRIIKFVTEQSARVVENFQQGINRMTSLVGLRRNNNSTSQASGQAVAAKPPQRASSGRMLAAIENESKQQVDSFDRARESLLGRLELVNKKLNDFEADWAEVMGRQQSPLIDRIPPRGVELWVDFWNTVRKQIRRINEEFMQLSRDVTRMVTGRNPSQGTQATKPTSSLASPSDALTENNGIESPVATNPNQDASSFKDFYDKMTKTLQNEQQKLDQLVQSDLGAEGISYIDQASNLIDEHDDELTKQELRRNPALRQQIQQEISVFGSIFDIMRAFMQRLRESASGVVRDIISPGSSTSNNNDAVTPTSAIKPAIDQILDQTIDSQRNINSQAKPVLLPNSRPSAPKPRSSL